MADPNRNRDSTIVDSFADKRFGSGTPARYLLLRSHWPPRTFREFEATSSKNTWLLSRAKYASPSFKENLPVIFNGDRGNHAYPPTTTNFPLVSQLNAPTSPYWTDTSLGTRVFCHLLGRCISHHLLSVAALSRA